MNKPLIVQKFGGTSVGSIERIQAVAEQVIKTKEQGNRMLVVVSAMSGETNRLMSLANQIDAVPNARELDVLLSSGEQVSMALLSMELNKLGYRAVSLTGTQARIITNQRHNDATISSVDRELLFSYFDQDTIVIVAGFQGMTENGDITTLGRGGSDTTAVTLAGLLSADECQIFTDVDGIYTTDPRVVPLAQKIDSIDFPSMERLASKGAKVLHLPCVQFAWKHKVPLRVLSSFKDGEGTIIRGEDVNKGISGLAIQQAMRLVDIENHTAERVHQQCKLLGIDIWNTLEDASRHAILIKEESFAKLKMVFADEIRNSEAVSVLTCVGLCIERVSEELVQYLDNNGCIVSHTFKEGCSASYLVTQEDSQRAANLIHQKFIVSDSDTLSDEKQKVFG
ncbi:aspartate kinase [Vibrio maerlii]|uniref:aspartate kinase n=1 Tax=Vibrio maerlii TaxID=2231648 RepID=UPI000E3C1DF1|nr:aspartate kinase [Vibrio maerlii]